MNLPALTPSRGSDRLSAYLTAVRALPRLGRDEELRLVERWQRDGDAGAREALLRSSLRATAAIALKYRRYGVPLDELIAEGNLAVVHALSKFDASRGIRFMTYAAFWVRAHVLNHVIGSFSLVGAGSGALRSKMFFKLRRERAKIQTLVGEGEHADELLARTIGLPPDKVQAMLRRLELRDVSLDLPPSDGARRTLGEDLAASNAGQDSILMDHELAERLRRAVAGAVSLLDQRERYIAERRLLADREDELSLVEVGRRFGVSRERARQLETRTKRKLREELERASRIEGAWLDELLDGRDYLFSSTRCSPISSSTSRSRMRSASTARTSSRRASPSSSNEFRNVS